MFYVKEKIGDTAEMTLEINDENVFCRCPKCGCEVRVDLVEVLRDEDSDLFGTAVYCDQCGKEVRDGLQDKS